MSAQLAAGVLSIIEHHRGARAIPRQLLLICGHAAHAKDGQYGIAINTGHRHIGGANANA